jgi:hypothetical protein
LEVGGEGGRGREGGMNLLHALLIFALDGVGGSIEPVSIM